MGDRTREHPYGTCERCGRSLQVSEENLSGGGYDRLCSGCHHDPEADFGLQDEGTLTLLWPRTDRATAWCGEHLPDDAIRWGDAYVVEPRYVENILNALREEGLDIEVTR